MNKRLEGMKGYNVTANIVAYEAGTLSEEETLQLFQYLVDTELAWKLQGSYGREAARLLENGEILPPDRGLEEKPLEGA